MKIILGVTDVLTLLGNRCPDTCQLALKTASKVKFVTLMPFNFTWYLFRLKERSGEAMLLTSGNGLCPL
jgi:hypothetical protein